MPYNQEVIDYIKNFHYRVIRSTMFLATPEATGNGKEIHKVLDILFCSQKIVYDRYIHQSVLQLRLRSTGDTVRLLWPSWARQYKINGTPVCNGDWLHQYQYDVPSFLSELAGFVRNNRYYGV